MAEDFDHEIVNALESMPKIVIHKAETDEFKDSQWFNLLFS